MTEMTTLFLTKMRLLKLHNKFLTTMTSWINPTSLNMSNVRFLRLKSSLKFNLCVPVASLLTRVECTWLWIFSFVVEFQQSQSVLSQQEQKEEQLDIPVADAVMEARREINMRKAYPQDVTLSTLTLGCVHSISFWMGMSSYKSQISIYLRDWENGPLDAESDEEMRL